MVMEWHSYLCHNVVGASVHNIVGTIVGVFGEALLLSILPTLTQQCGVKVMQRQIVRRFANALP